MVAPITNSIRKSSGKWADGRSFSESEAWREVGGGWRQIHGNLREVGFSIEWHDFSTRNAELDWAQSFHPGAVEICLNLTGSGEVRAKDRALAFSPFTVGFYAQNKRRLVARRNANEQHQFITIELSLPFLEHHITPDERGLYPRLGSLFAHDARAGAIVSDPIRLTNEHQQLVMSLRRPPVHVAAQRLWYQAKALEVAAALLYQPLPGEELFCERQKRMSHDRVTKVIKLLKENLSEPLSLEEIGKRVGCSHFHLSRTFTQEMGKTISAHLRDLRMERAAELLREGRLNVTQVAMDVGYSSPSHFSTAFHEVYGCCPGLYPLKTFAQKGVKP